MPSLTPPSWPILAPLLGLGVAIAWPRPIVSAVAVLALSAVLGLHLPALGPVAVALSIAIGLAGLAVVQPPGTARYLHLFAFAWGLVALPAAPLPADLTVPGHVATALACVILAASTAAAVQWAGSPARRLGLAALVLALPLAPLGESLVSWQAGVVLPHEGVASSWLATGTFAALPDLAWAPFGPLTTWAHMLALVGLLVAWARWLRPTVALGKRLPLGLLALAGLLSVAATIGDARGGSVHVPGTLLPLALPAGALLDPTLVLAWLARLVTAAALFAWRPTVHLQPVRVGRALTLGLALVAAWLVLALWIATAPPWHGYAWLADSWWFAIAAVLLTSAAALPALWQGPSLARDLAQVLQVAAALCLVGGAQAGWRVAGLLLGP